MIGTLLFTLDWDVRHTVGVEGGAGVGRSDVVWAGFIDVCSVSDRVQSKD